VTIWINERGAHDDGGRRYPRSTREAFPDERGQWWEPPDNDESLTPLWAGLLAGAVMLALAVVLFV